MLRVLVNVIQSHSAMSTELNAFIYFGIGGVLNIGCGLSFLLAIRSAFVRFHLREYFWTRKYRGIKGTVTDRLQDNVLKRADTETILKKLVDDALPTPRPCDFAMTPTVGPTVDAMASDKVQQSPHRNPGCTVPANKQIVHIPQSQRLPKRSESTTVDTGAIAMDAFSINKSTMSEPRVPTPKSNDVIRRTQWNEEAVTFLGVFRKMKLLFLSLFMVWFMTFLPFPGMLVALESEHRWIRDGGWMPVFLVLIFNVSDYIGRQFIAAYTTFSFSKRTLWIGCAWRFLLYPVFVVLYRGTIRNDWLAFGATAALGVTNGHFTCLLFMWAPSLCNAKEQPLMGSMMSFALVMGIVCGSNLTLLLHTAGVL